MSNLLPFIPPLFEPAGAGPESFEDPIDRVPEGERKTVDEVLIVMGRRGGPSAHGWHSQENEHLCPRRAMFDRRVGGPFAGTQTSLALAVGSILHEYLADRYARIAEDRTLEEVAAKVEATTVVLKQHGHDRAAEEARRLYYGYAVKYDPFDEFTANHKVVAVEQLLEHELPWGQVYSGRADIVLEAPDGLVIVDHKTSRARDMEFNEGWALDPAQIGLQWLATKKYGRVVGYYINGVIKTQKPDYPRIFFRYEKRILRDWLAMMKYRHLERQMAAAAGYPPNFANCLVRRGEGGFRRCRWWDACALGIKPNARTLETF